MYKLILVLLPFLIISLVLYLNNLNTTKTVNPMLNGLVEAIPQVTPSPSPKITLNTPPESKVLPGGIQVFQTYNNCGPAALSMALSHYGIQKTQQELGLELRPYQVVGGDNDDKSVTLEELAEKSQEFGFIPYHRPNGDIGKIKLFINYDMPVITRTWLKENDDIGHYRVIKGYDGETIIQDDSLQGKNLRYAEFNFNAIWKKFNYEYLVLVPKDKQGIAEIILGEDIDSKKAWSKAIQFSLDQLQKDPDDIYARFNLSVAYYNIENYASSVEEFEKVESRLPFRTLWYQIEPIKAYYELGEYERVFEITDRVLNYHNRAFSELYLIRGNIYLKQGNQEAARSEFEKAVRYNTSLKVAQEALNNLNNL